MMNDTEWNVLAAALRFVMAAQCSEIERSDYFTATPQYQQLRRAIMAWQGALADEKRDGPAHVHRGGIDGRCECGFQVFTIQATPCAAVAKRDA